MGGKNIIRGYVKVMLLLFILCVVVGCKDSPAPPVITDVDHPIPPAGEFSDSLMNILLPVILAEPAERKIETWFKAEGEWRDKFGTSDELVRYIDEAAASFTRAGDFRKACFSTLAKGRIQFREGQNAKSIETLQTAYELALKTQDSVSIAWALGFLGSPYTSSGNLTTGKSYYERSLEIGKRLNHPGLRASGEFNLGTLSAMQGSLGIAREKIQKTLDISREHNLNSMRSIATLNLSMIYIMEERYDEAINYLQDNLKIEDGQQNMATTTQHLNLFEAYMGKKDYSQAELHLDVACDLAESIDFGFGILYCWDFKAQLAEARGDYALALESFKKFHEIQNEQDGREAKEQLELLENTMRLREKDFEIDRLNEEQLKAIAEQDHTQRLFLGVAFILLLLLVGTYFGLRVRHRAKTAEQSKAIAEAKLQVLHSQMNPHFVYNALSGIQNYILKKEPIEAYNYLNTFSDLLRSVTNSSTKVQIGLDQEVDFIRAYLEMEKLRFRDGFEFEVNVAESLLSENKYLPCMMIQPAVENAIVHGLSNINWPGKLTVDFASHQDGLVCTVTDNGKGRDEATRIKTKQSERGHLSIATINTQKRLEALRKLGYGDANVTIEDLNDEQGRPAGTQVQIYLPFVDSSAIKLN